MALGYARYVFCGSSIPGYSSVGQSACMGCRRPQVQVLLPRPSRNVPCSEKAAEPFDGSAAFSFLHLSPCFLVFQKGASYNSSAFTYSLCIFARIFYENDQVAAHERVVRQDRYPEKGCRRAHGAARQNRLHSG